MQSLGQTDSRRTISRFQLGKARFSGRHGFRHSSYFATQLCRKCDAFNEEPAARERFGRKTLKNLSPLANKS
jgi:hypothetical protein